MSVASLKNGFNNLNNHFNQEYIPNNYNNNNNNGTISMPMPSPSNNVINNLIPNSIKTGLNESNSKKLSNDVPEIKSKMTIAYLDEIIEDYAQYIFRLREKDFYKSLGKSHGWNELTKVIDYKKLKVRHQKPKYDNDALSKKPKSSVLFRSTFVNDTDYEQEYQLRTERRTTSSCQIEITEGYVTEKSGEAALEIELPGIVAGAGAGFKQEYCLENTTSKTVQEEMTWSIESNVKVQSMSKATADLVVEEHQYSGRFEFKTYFSGKVTMKLYKDNVELLKFDLGDLSEILTSNKGFKKDDDGLFILTKGQCKANFGIEQKVELHQYPLINGK